MWRAADLERPCSCGQSITECAVWGPALDSVAAATGVQRADYDAFAALTRRVLRTRRARQLSALSPDRPETWPGEVRRYVQVVGQLLRGVAAASGARTLVDSSKLPPGFLTLALDPGLAVDVVHLLRDPRAVANSERKTRVRTGPDAAMLPPGRSSLRSAVYWSGFNLAVRHYGRRMRSYQVVRYEDFVAEPEAHLGALEQTLAMEAAPPAATARGLAVGHLAEGNPSRFRTQGTTYAVDLSWKVELPRAERAAVTAVSLPARGLLR